MSKGFDTVRRNYLFDNQNEILDADEIHMSMTLVEDVKLIILVGKAMGNKISTKISAQHFSSFIYQQH